MRSFTRPPRIGRAGRVSPFRRAAARWVEAGGAAAAAAALLLGGGAAAARADDFGARTAYAPVVLRAHAADRNGRPLAGLRLRFTGVLDGQAAGWEGGGGGGRSEPCYLPFTVRAVTDRDGVAVAQVRRPRAPRGGAGPWFRGRLAASVAPDDAAREISLLEGSRTTTRAELPAAPEVGPEARYAFDLRAFEEPDTTADGFPVWAARDGGTGRVVVVLEGFDVYNDYSATTVMRLLAGAADALRQRGIAFLVVNYPDSRVAPDRLAPLAERAIRAAARLSGGKVAVAGLSMGGIVARWALVEAENRGDPLPVHTLLELDTPNRGANVNPGLQAMILRYGKRADREGMRSDAARALLVSRPAEVRWRRLGLPPADRSVPVAWRDDTREHDLFYGRLRALNDRNGYPRSCRLVGVANSSRRHGEPERRDLLRLWLPWGYGWTLKARDADHGPGTGMPVRYMARFARQYPLGIAGAGLRFAPTFVSAESALDAGPDETPPFDAFYAHPDDRPNLPHDDVDGDTARYVVREILSEPWGRRPARPAGAAADG